MEFTDRSGYWARRRASAHAKRVKSAKSKQQNDRESVVSP
jgi:hypothetical protein